MIATDIQSQKVEIEKQITNAGFSFDFKGMSEANGMSIYFEINGNKCRFSNHSVTNSDRVFNEKHFDLPFVKTIGFGGIKEVYNDNVNNFKHL